MDRTHILRALLCVGTSVFALGAAPSAFAQTEPEVANTAEIIVTAQRREETINSVGMGIQAFTGEQLEQLHVTDVRDLSSVAPSFSVQQSYQGVPIYTLRGIGFNTINLSATSTVGSYVDEVAYPFPFMMTGPIFDVQRVEVLKGPQGTLYGRNTTAGLVDFITNRPTDEVEASITAEYGNYQTHNVEGFFSAPLSEALRFRVAFRSEDSNEGWQQSNTRDETQGEVHRLGGRARVEWDVTDRFQAEPFFFQHGALGCWRANPALEALNKVGAPERFGVGAAIIAPAYMPGGVIGAVVWATADVAFDVSPVYARHAADLHALALHFVAADHDHSARHAALLPVQLTRREIQCLKWGAAGKTDGEVGAIMSISVPTVRFHMTNAARKLGVVGRSQAIYRAATLGYVGTAPSHT